MANKTYFTKDGKIEIQLNFTDFWPGFDKTNNFFYNLLIEKYNVIISDKPDLLFYSTYSFNHINYSCTKVLFTGENERPDFMMCDFAFSYDYSSNKRNYRLPLYALYDNVTKLINRKIDADYILKRKKKFCCFIVSNEGCNIRNNFFLNLSKYKQIDSGGKVFNNIGQLVENKLDFIKDYKFVIAFENTSHPGYTTEKVFEPLQQNCIPIYWGNPLIGDDFNTKSFVNCHEYSSFDEVIKQVIEIDKNDELYMQYLNEPVFVNNKLNEFVKKENIVNRLDEIIAFHYNTKFKIRSKIRPLYFFLKTRIKKIRTSRIILKKIIRKLVHLISA